MPSLRLVARHSALPALRQLTQHERSKLRTEAIIRPIIIAALALGTAAPAATAQSITLGAVSGAVLDEAGQPLAGVRVVLTESNTQFERVIETGRGGVFAFTFLPVATYELLAERLWYLPVRMDGIVVRAGRESTIRVRLVRTPPPIQEAQRERFRDGTSGLSSPGMSRPGTASLLADLELARLPDMTRGFSRGARYISTSTGQLQTEGLPGEAVGVAVDGVVFQSANHADPSVLAARSLAFPLTSVDEAVLHTNGLDVEWSEYAGAMLSGTARPGTQKLQVRAFGDWWGSSLAGSRYFDPAALTFNNFRGGVLVSAPVIPDSAEFVLGAEAARLEIPRPAVWGGTPLDSALLAVASDSFGVDLGAWTQPRLLEVDVGSAFGRFDWRMLDGHALSVRGSAARLETKSPDLGRGHLPALGAELEGTDASGASTLSNRLARWLVSELRLGMDWSMRDYGETQLPATVIVEGPAGFGSDPSLPGRFERLGFRLSETLHFLFGAHRLKLGGFLSNASYDQTFDARRAGAFAFGGVDEFARTEGVFVQTVGPLPVAKFSTLQTGGYLQYNLRAASGVDLKAGLRVDVEILPNDKVPPDRDWGDRTGLDSTLLERTHVKFVPRLGFTWDIGNWHRWLVEGKVGVYWGRVTPALLSEWIVRSGSARVRRAVGPLGTWPAVPDSLVAPPLRSTLTMFGPDYRAPATTRASFGLSGSLDPRTLLHLSVAYRHTDFLPRREDLNVIATAVGQDQHRRPIYGRLVQQGSLIAAEPGSNRRFEEFDVVSALNADGFSNYWGVNVGLERRVGKVLNLVASYTYSQTTDNWLAGGRGTPERQLTPFPEGLNGLDWREGRSDFDVPHRVVVGAEFGIGFVSLAGFYRYQSGRPITPGFRAGVDVNGDGSAGNDPAFVDDGIEGVSELFADWDCLRANVGRFVERNACRQAGVHTLDLRLAIVPVRIQGIPLEIVVDGLNLIESDVADPDRALYLIDHNASVSRDPVTGDVTIPLVVNPNFGKPIIRRTPGWAIRIGVRINYE